MAQFREQRRAALSLPCERDAETGSARGLKPATTLCPLSSPLPRQTHAKAPAGPHERRLPVHGSAKTTSGWLGRTCCCGPCSCSRPSSWPRPHSALFLRAFPSSCRPPSTSALCMHLRPALHRLDRDATAVARGAPGIELRARVCAGGRCCASHQSIVPLLRRPQSRARGGGTAVVFSSAHRHSRILRGRSVTTGTPTAGTNALATLLPMRS